MKRLTVRMSEKLHRELQRLSRERDLSLNEVVTTTLERAVDEGHWPSSERSMTRKEETNILREALKDHLVAPRTERPVKRPSFTPIKLPPGSKLMSETMSEDREDTC